MSRRYYRHRRSSHAPSSPESLLLVFIFVLVLVIYVSIASSTGDFSLFFIVFAFDLLFLIVVGSILKSPTIKGKLGERRISKILNKLTNKYGGAVINDVIVMDESGMTSQIDHILVSQYGVFVVETKNYAGRIYGNDTQQNWVQVLAFGNTKNKLYNPVKQNATHIHRLKNAIHMKIEMESIVVFVKGNINYIDSEYVYTPSSLKRIINKRSQKVFDEATVDKIYEAIKVFKDNPVQSTKEHVQEIKQREAMLERNICPRCGGQLVQRVSKTNGTVFMGCINYPRCRFIKKD